MRRVFRQRCEAYFPTHSDVTAVLTAVKAEPWRAREVGGLDGHCARRWLRCAGRDGRSQGRAFRESSVNATLSAPIEGALRPLPGLTSGSLWWRPKLSSRPVRIIALLRSAIPALTYVDRDGLRCIWSIGPLFGSGPTAAVPFLAGRSARGLPTRGVVAAAEGISNVGNFLTAPSARGRGCVALTSIQEVFEARHRVSQSRPVRSG